MKIKRLAFVILLAAAVSGCATNNNIKDVIAIYNKAESSQRPPTDYSQQAIKYRSEADMGNAKAMRELGVLHAYGLGVPKSYPEALKWSRLAAERGEARAMFDIGYMYEHGLGMQADLAEAAKWYFKAAENNDVWALNNIGAMYENGRGLETDYNRAMEYYKRAASLGDTYAMVNIGNMYYSGRGVPENMKEAVQWYQRAAHLGYAGAMAALSKIYHDGKAAEKDYKYAYAWAALALERSQSKAEKDKHLPLAIHMAGELDADEFEHAKKLKNEISEKIRNFELTGAKNDSSLNSSAVASDFPEYFAPVFENNGQRLKFSSKSEKDGFKEYLFFTTDNTLGLSIIKHECDRPRGAGILENIIYKTNDNLKNKKGEFIEINKNDMHAEMVEGNILKSVFVYVLPKGIQIWTYSRNSDARHDVRPQFNLVKNFINKQRYSEALLEGNVSLGVWGAEIYEYACRLSQEGKKKEHIEVLEKLIAASPHNYRAHMDFAENTDDRKAAAGSAKIVMKGSEDPKLAARASKLLGLEQITFASIPILEKGETGLQLILIPLEPCDISLLKDAAKTYENMTNIPVKLRRLKEAWILNGPDRVVCQQRQIQEILARGKGAGTNFTAWDKARYYDELRKSAKDALERYSIDSFIAKIDKEEGQYLADGYLARFLDIIEQYRSNDIRTMYVGITGINIYSGDTNYVFSLFSQRKNKCQASLMSYYMMMASHGADQYELRTRLTDRIAKELAPASLKSLGIPRSADPACPYSYSGGVSRVDEKTLILSEQVRNAIEAIKMKTPSNSQ